MRLRTKFALVFLAVTLVLSASVVVAIEFYRGDAVGESRANVEETATLAAEQIDAALRERRDYVGLVASRPQARQFDHSGAFLDALLANSRFYAVQLVAANGTVLEFRGDVTATRRRAVIGSDRADASYVRAALDGRSYVGEAQAVDGTDDHAVVISAPIFEDGDVEGVLVAAMYLDTRTVFEGLPPLATSSQTVTVTADGTALHGSDRSFESSIEASATVNATGWAVALTRDRSALDARLGQLALFQTGQLGLVVLTMVGFGYWQYAASLRQTERLLDGFDDLATGDYERRVSLGGGTEWEQIGDGFNDLGATLRDREAALRERTQRLDVMYRVLRHNLRNQLSVIVTYADVLVDRGGEDRASDAARSIRDAGQRLQHLSERARQIETALEADQKPTPVEVSSVVSEVVTDLRECYPAVEIETSLPAAAWTVALPSVRLAIESVCENACEHNDAEDPRVDVTVETVASSERGETPSASAGEGVDGDGRVRITVTDNGPGIPESERAAIREGRETALEHASGLGLWLAYWVVDGSDGNIQFEDLPSGGSVVRIGLPRGSGPEKPGTDAAPEPPGSE